MKEEKQPGHLRPPIMVEHDESVSPCVALVLTASLLSVAILVGCGGDAHLSQTGFSSGFEDPSQSNRHHGETATNVNRAGALAAARAAGNAPRAGSVTQSSDVDALGVTLDTVDVEM